MPQDAPDHVVALAEARADARSRSDWPEADRLRAEIEAAGWKVVDAGVSFTLAPAHPPDVVVGGRTRYGHPSSVPSHLADPPARVASVVVLAGEQADAVGTTLDSLRSVGTEPTQVVLVADAPSDALAAVLEEAVREHAERGSLEVELVLTSERLGPAAALDAGLRRADASVVVVLGSGVEIGGDVVAPLVDALEDPSVAVAGRWGVVTDDLRHLRDADAGDVDAIDIACLALRRSDYAARGPVDERLRSPEYVGLWLSLALREEQRPSTRRAVALGGLPVARSSAGAADAAEAEDGSGDEGSGRDRLERRDYYRVLQRFGPRSELFGSRRPATSAGETQPKG